MLEMTAYWLTDWFIWNFRNGGRRIFMQFCLTLNISIVYRFYFPSQIALFIISPLLWCYTNKIIILTLIIIITAMGPWISCRWMQRTDYEPHSWHVSVNKILKHLQSPMMMKTMQWSGWKPQHSWNNIKYYHFSSDATSLMTALLAYIIRWLHYSSYNNSMQRLRFSSAVSQCCLFIIVAIEIQSLSH